MNKMQFRPSRFEILPVIIKNLLIINALVFLAQNCLSYTLPQHWIENTFALHTWQSQLFRPWQLITHLFLHGGSLSDPGHLLGNMFALWMFGSTLENLWGPKKFLMFYMVCGLGAALCHMSVLFFENQTMIQQYNAIITETDVELFLQKYPPVSMNQTLQSVYYSHINEATLGASGAVFGCLAAFGYLFPNTYLYIYFLFPLKAKWFVIIYSVLELVMAVKNTAGDNVAHVAHLGGALVALVLVYFWNKTNRKTFY